MSTIFLRIRYNNTFVKQGRGTWESQEHLAQALQAVGITSTEMFITQHEHSHLGETWGVGEAALVFIQQRAKPTAEYYVPPQELRRAPAPSAYCLKFHPRSSSLFLLQPIKLFQELLCFLSPSTPNCKLHS